MSIQALLTLDLIEVDDKYRELFYEYLEDLNWHKLSAPETTWRISFKDSFTKEQVNTYIPRILKEAKLSIDSKLPKIAAKKVIYAFQKAPDLIKKGEI